MGKLAKLFLFVHPMPYRASAVKEYMAKWTQLIRSEAPKEENAICLFSNPPHGMEDLRALARKQFGERCFIDPDDNSNETKLLMAEDLQRTLSSRGRYTEWIPYEIFTSNFARRWAEGLKRAFKAFGYTYDSDLAVVSCGQQWGGCLTKYSMFVAKYLGVCKTPDVRADLSPDAAFPLKAKFIERIALDRHVCLFLFETPAGRWVGQFTDGLRAVWEPPHIAVVKIDPSKVETCTTSPNAYIKVRERAKFTRDGIVADVMDGCNPANTTILSHGIDYNEFKDALAKARIEPREERCRVLYHFDYMDPITVTRTNEGEHK